MLPTSDGIALFQEVQDHFVGLERIASAANRIRNFEAHTLRIATIPSVSFGLLPLAVPAFRAHHPSASLTIEVRTFESVVHHVLTAQCDLGFTAYPTDRPGVEIEPLLTAEAVCAMSSASPLASNDIVEAEDLRGLPFVSLESNAPSRRRIDKVFESRGIERQLVLETQNGAVVCALVKHDTAVSVIDPLSALSFGDPALVVRPFRPRLEFTFYALWRADMPPSRMATSFVDRVREAIKSHSDAIPVIEIA
jgi:DNA-binding transcriptional LysR family regulator